MLSDHEHNISVLSNLGLIERCNKPNTNTKKVMHSCLLDFGERDYTPSPSKISFYYTSSAIKFDLF